MSTYDPVEPSAHSWGRTSAWEHLRFDEDALAGALLGGFNR